jgi:hypothetical protein
LFLLLCLTLYTLPVHHVAFFMDGESVHRAVVAAVFVRLDTHPRCSLLTELALLILDHRPRNDADIIHLIYWYLVQHHL